MTKFIEFSKGLFKNDDGATAIEYGLLAALISVGIIGAVSLVGNQMENTFEGINTTLETNGVSDAP